MNNTSRPRLNLSVKTKFIHTLRAMKQYNNNIFDSVEGVAYPKLEEQYPKLSEQLQIHAGKGDIDSINRLLSNEIDFETIFPSILTAATFGHADTMQHLMQFLTPWLTLTAITTQPENERSILHDIDQWLSNAMQEYNAKSIAIKKDTLTICIASSGLITTLPHTTEVETGEILPKSFKIDYILCPAGYRGTRPRLTTGFKTALSLSACIGNVRALNNLFSQLTDSQTRQKEFREALDFATSYNQCTIIDFLHQQGVDIDQIVCITDNCTALSLAAEYGHINVMRQLMRLGADLNKPDINLDTPLMIAAKKGHTDAYELLIRSGALINQSNHVGYNELFLAVDGGSVAIVKSLLANGIDTSHSIRGVTPLHHAATLKSSEIAGVLLNHGLNPNQISQWGTPLHFAANVNQVDTVKLLLSFGADPSLKNNRNMTPLDIATRKNHPEIVTILEEFQATTVTDNALSMFASNTTQSTSSSLTTNLSHK